MLAFNNVHGGDIYRNRVSLDFSVNVNPLGVPEAVTKILHEAVDMCGVYPDMSVEKLKTAVSESLSVPKEYLLFGNGASELFMAIAHALRPQKTVIPIPSFYGYEYAIEAVGGEIAYYLLKEEKDFLMDEDFFEVLKEDVDILFLANPNNPTGRLLKRAYLKDLFDFCKSKKIMVVLDESFIEFCGQDASVSGQIGEYDNLLIIRSFTKIYAIPGVRLGYILCSNPLLSDKVKRQLPEWNLSVFAQAAGRVCIEQGEYVMKTSSYVNRERAFLTHELCKQGLKVFPSEANFILLQSKSSSNLYQILLEQGILIRDCENFRGLSKGYYRIAVKSREENELLLRAIEAK